MLQQIMREVLIFLSIFSFLNLSCSDLSPGPNKNHKVELIQTIGDSSSIEFARISGLALSQNDKFLYVLDSNFKKVFVFDSLGNHTHSIEGGYGRGPGEFNLPTAITVTSDGLILVYDYTLRRSTFFDHDGKVIGTIPTPVPTKNITILENKIWASILGGRIYQVASLNLLGGDINYDLPPDNREKEFSPDGGVVSIEKGKSGNLLIAAVTPGIWYEQDRVNGNFVKKGKDLLVKKVGWITKDNIRISPGSVLAIGEILNDKVGIVWRELKKSKENRAPVFGDTKLEIFNSENGEHIDTIVMPFKLAYNIKFGKKDTFYISESEPIPQVKKFQIKMDSTSIN